MYFKILGVGEETLLLLSNILLKHFFQDVFTSGIGWMLFGGLPYDLVNTIPLGTLILDWCLVHSVYSFLCNL